MSLRKTVALAFMPLLIVLMAAERSAAIMSPSNPVGTCVTIKYGKTLSP
jgi:hypothetical protein